MESELAVTYTDLLGNDPVVHFLDGWNFSRANGVLFPLPGYYAFAEYLKCHLGRSYNQIVGCMQGDTGYEITQTADVSESTLVLNLPIDLYGEMTDLVRLVHSAKKVIGVVHDSRIAFGSTGFSMQPLTMTQPLGIDAGARFKRFQSNNVSLMAMCDYVVFPSMYTQRIHAHMMPHNKFGVIPHPFEEKVDQYRLHVEQKAFPRHVLLNTFYKHDQIAYGPLIQNLIGHGYKVLLPFNENAIFMQTSMIESGSVDFLFFRGHSNMYWAMQNVAAVADITSHSESFGFFVREALHLGATVYAKRVGAFEDLEHRNVCWL